MKVNTNYSQKQNPSFQLRMDKHFIKSAIKSAKNDGELRTVEKRIKEIMEYGDSQLELGRQSDGNALSLINPKMKGIFGNLSVDVKPYENPIQFLKLLTEEIVNNAEYFMFKDFAKQKGLSDKPKAALNLLHHKIDNKTFLKFKEYITTGIPPFRPSKGFEARQNELVNKLAK